MKLIVRSCVVLTSLLFLMPVLSVAGGLEVIEPWVRMPPPVADTAAGYMRLKNTSNKLIQIIKIESNVSPVAEFHSMSMHKGMMHMGKMDDIRIQPGEELVFSSGSNHLMLIGLNKNLDENSKVKLKFIAKDGSIYKVEINVRDMRNKHAHHH